LFFTWYTDDAKELEAELSNNLKSAGKTLDKGLLKGIIGPHAGYSFSGPTAAWAYNNIDASKYNRVVLLGPSHTCYVKKCVLSKCDIYDTPLGDIPVDREATSDLNDANPDKFDFFKGSVEEDEHSLEMHLPYIRKIFKGKDIKLVPIMVGSLSGKSEKEYGQILAPYLKDKHTLFVISSDFCHWGSHFDYFYYKKEDGEIYESIDKLDKQGMGLIEKHDPDGFRDYIEKTGNTVCGAHPIGVFLEAVNASGLNLETKFVHYAQSDQVKNKKGTSVSYASSYTTLVE